MGPSCSQPLASRSDPQQPFECSVEPDRARVRVRVRGEIDLETVDAVENRLRAVRDAGFHHIELSLADVTFMDSAGLHLVLRWAAESSRDGFAFAVTDCSSQARRLFELTRTSHLLDRQPSDDYRGH
jgi:anti-sigma B factor antagonist